MNIIVINGSPSGTRGVTANAIMAGVTDTPALRKIPGNEKMMAAAKAKNPGARLTTAMDVAKTIVRERL